MPNYIPRFQQNFRKLTGIVPGIDTMKAGNAIKLKAPGFMDLCVEVIGRSPKDGRTIVSLAHYGEQNGDLMADPEMEIAVDFAGETVEALTFSNHYVNVRQVVYPEEGKYYPKLKQELNSFLSTWLTNIRHQGHRLPDMVDQLKAPA